MDQFRAIPARLTSLCMMNQSTNGRLRSNNGAIILLEFLNIYILFVKLFLCHLLDPLVFILIIPLLYSDSKMRHCTDRIGVDHWIPRPWDRNQMTNAPFLFSPSFFLSIAEVPHNLSILKSTPLGLAFPAILFRTFPLIMLCLLLQPPTLSASILKYL